MANYDALIAQRKRESEEKQAIVMHNTIKLMAEGKDFTITELARISGVHRNSIIKYKDIMELIKTYKYLKSLIPKDNGKETIDSLLSENDRLKKELEIKTKRLETCKANLSTAEEKLARANALVKEQKATLKELRSKMYMACT